MNQRFPVPLPVGSREPLTVAAGLLPWKLAFAAAAAAAVSFAFC